MWRSTRSAFGVLVVTTTGVVHPVSANVPHMTSTVSLQDTVGFRIHARLPTASPAGAPSAEALWASVDLALTRLRALDDGALPLIAPVAEDCVLPVAAEAEREAYVAQGAASRRDPGLSLEAGGRLGFQDRPLEEGATGAYVGVAMDVFQSGFFENRKLGEVMTTRSDEAAVRARLARLEAENRCRAESTVLQLVPLTRQLLEYKAEAIQQIAVAYREAYLSGTADLDAVLESEAEVYRTETELSTIDAMGYGHPAGGAPRFPPVMDLAIEEIVQRIEADELSTRLLELRQRETRLGREIDDETRLRVYVRYALRANNSGSDGVSAGLVFRRPLFGGIDAGLDHELEAERRRTESAVATRVAATRATHQRFRSQLVRTVRQHYLYLESLERVRRSRTERQVDSSTADLGRALERLTELYNAALERAAALRELQASAAQVFVVANQPFDATLLQPMALPGPRYRGRLGHRAIYIWSEAFNRLDNDYLLAMLEAKGFGRVLLSGGRETEPDKLAEFQRRAESAGLVTELMLGTNAWLDPQRRDGVTARVSQLSLPPGGLHLDVEPQARDDFREQAERYYEAYLDVIARARAAAGAAPLSVSVPVWWPASMYRRIAEQVDKIYLMAYAETDAERLIERLRPMLNEVERDKLVLTLRASDYASEWEMELVRGRVSATTEIEDVAVHDLAGFLDLIQGRS